MCQAPALTKVLLLPTPDAPDTAMRARKQIPGRTTPDGLLESLSLQRVLRYHAVQAKPRRACRHTYSSLLNEHGTDVKVQQELLRHADIRTTMNIYTRAVPERLRTANSKLVRLLLPTGTTSRA
jgi:integrase